MFYIINYYYSNVLNIVNLLTNYQTKTLLSWE